jgi:dCMP deaminase
MEIKNKKFLMGTAELWAEASYSKRNKVGAVISKDGRIVATGYNGTLPGEDNCCENSDNTTKQTVAHAEQNAILFCAKYGLGTNECELYTTLSPCVECAKLIITSGIKKVHYLVEYRDIAGLRLLKNFNIEIIKYDNN